MAEPLRKGRGSLKGGWTEKNNPVMVHLASQKPSQPLWWLTAVLTLDFIHTYGMHICLVLLLHFLAINTARPVRRQNRHRSRAKIHSITESTDTPAKIPRSPPMSETKFSNWNSESQSRKHERNQAVFLLLNVCSFHNQVFHHNGKPSSPPNTHWFQSSAPYRNSGISLGLCYHDKKEAK